MKYVVTWELRDGASAGGNAEATRESLGVFTKWSPPPDQTFHQFLGRIDGRGGFAVVETDNAASLLDAPAKFGPYFNFTIYPVVEVAELAQASAAAIEFRDSIG